MKKSEKKALEIIGIAGEGRREVFKALQIAKKGDLTEAKFIMKEAKKILGEYESIDKEFKKCLLMVHAQDHLMNSLVIYDIVDELIEIYLEGKIG